MITQCPHCGGLNRISEENAATAKCGKCKEPLFVGKPIEMNQAQFERAFNKTDQTLIVDFWAPWCGPCQGFAPVFSQAAAQLEPKAKLIKINTEQEQMLAGQMNIRSIPTLAIFRNGQEITRISGAMDLQNFLAWAKQHL